ncbi:MAG: hypothetical protein ACK4NS_03135 [Saprospiraceae bacterium]
MQKTLRIESGSTTPPLSEKTFFTPKENLTNLVQRQTAAAPPRPQVPMHIFLLHGVSDSVAVDIARATQVFSAGRLDFPYAVARVSESETQEILGTDGILQKSREGATRYTEEEVSLIIPRFHRGALNVFYVPRVSDRSTAGYTMNIAGENVIIIDQANNQSISHKPLEHEIGHALGLAHLPTETRDPEASLQLMWPGLRRDNRLSPAEMQTILSSRYVRRP